MMTSVMMLLHMMPLHMMLTFHSVMMASHSGTTVLHTVTVLLRTMVLLHMMMTSHSVMITAHSGTTVLHKVMVLLRTMMLLHMMMTSHAVMMTPQSGTTVLRTVMVLLRPMVRERKQSPCSRLEKNGAAWDRATRENKRQPKSSNQFVASALIALACRHRPKRRWARRSRSRLLPNNECHHSSYRRRHLHLSVVVAATRAPVVVTTMMARRLRTTMLPAHAGFCSGIQTETGAFGNSRKNGKKEREWLHHAVVGGFGRMWCTICVAFYAQFSAFESYKKFTGRTYRASPWEDRNKGCRTIRPTSLTEHEKAKSSHDCAFHTRRGDGESASAAAGSSGAGPPSMAQPSLRTREAVAVPADTTDENRPFFAMFQNAYIIADNNISAKVFPAFNDSDHRKGTPTIQRQAPLERFLSALYF